MAFLCVDVGGTNTLIGVGNGDFEIVERKSSDEFLEDIGSCLEDVIPSGKMENIDTVAIAAAGPLDREKGVFYPPNIEHMDKIQIKKPLQEFGEVKIINDCTSAVLGEYYYGEHGTEDLVYVTISSGIGSGVILNGELLEGFDGNFGEIGHMSLEEDGLECGCGSNGCWEAYCSGNNLPEFAEEITDSSFEDARHLFEEYKNGDKAAEKVMERMQEFNARGFANLVNLYNPEKIVLGGAVALNHPEKIVDPLEEKVGPLICNGAPDIELCNLEDEAVLHGLRAVCNGKY